MRINKWSATIAALAVIFAGGVCAEQGKAKEQAKHGAQAPAREEIKDRQRDMEDAADHAKGMRETAREERSVSAREEQGKGAQTSAEMQERRDERKAIKEEYRSGDNAKADHAGKKPWWKFWGSDDDDS